MKLVPVSWEHMGASGPTRRFFPLCLFERDTILVHDSLPSVVNRPLDSTTLPTHQDAMHAPFAFVTACADVINSYIAKIGIYTRWLVRKSRRSVIRIFTSVDPKVWVAHNSWHLTCVTKKHILLLSIYKIKSHKVYVSLSDPVLPKIPCSRAFKSNEWWPGRHRSLERIVIIAAAGFSIRDVCDRFLLN